MVCVPAPGTDSLSSPRTHHTRWPVSLLRVQIHFLALALITRDGLCPCSGPRTHHTRWSVSLLRVQIHFLALALITRDGLCPCSGYRYTF
ncbi:hypothetical protein J6590_064458 [Homalodisca vitripennis]|nr:hypothetical protein J6590_064458 [Homalodisca vitripennis]